MEDLFEFVLELLFGVLDAASNTKTWIKTATFLLITESIAGFCGFISIRAYQQGNVEGCGAMAILAALVGIGSIISAIYLHKRDWIN